jgi:3-oxoacyl-[acyl-carrier-protein] synthase-3
MASSVKECLQRAQLTEKEISWLVPHQANIRIMDAMAKQIDLEDGQVYKTVHKYGNTSASSIAIAMDELIHAHEIKIGENLLLVAFGGGLTWGAGILTRVEG